MVKAGPISLDKQTAFITGANSGVGFEAAAQMAEAGVNRVILGCRNIERATEARHKLIKRTGRDVFEIVIVDVADLKSAAAAATILAERKIEVDLLVLNAGGPRRKFSRTEDGLEMTLAINVLGHHVLTMSMLENNVLTPDAHIIIAGSELARGEMGMGRLYDYQAVQSEVQGGLDLALDSFAHGNQPVKFDSMRVYGNSKLWATWWAFALADKVAEGMTVLIVSPGSAPATNAIKQAPIIMRPMITLFKILGPFMKMAGPVSAAAER